MSRACSMHEKDAKHILNIILKKWIRETIWQTYA
jgi:hypothetical protein